MKSKEISKNNIILIGPMGAGKTSVSTLYSKKYSCNFIDIDFEIEKNENMKIEDIFKNKGEEYFRKLEKAFIFNLNVANSIISTGGGIVEDVSNLIKLKEIGRVFYLKASFDVILKRLENDKTRPLLNCENKKEKLISLIEKREKNYKMADMIIDTDKKTIDEVSEIIYENKS